MKRKKLSVIIIARDEEGNIKDCLESVKWADEIVVVVDDRTTDKTAQIAKKYTDKVYLKKFEGFGRQCQFALQKATGGWVLKIDADERTTPELKREILEVIQTKRFSGYHVFFQEVYLGKLVPFRPIEGTERLVKKGWGYFTDAPIHERLIVKGKIGTLSNPLVHYSGRSLAQIITKFNRYTTLEAEILVGAGTKFSLWRLFLSPVYNFAKLLFLYKTYQWGFRGLIYSALRGCLYHFLKHLKIWELEQEGD